MPRTPHLGESLGNSPDLKHARSLDHGRLPLPFSKFCRLFAIRVYTSKALAVFVENSDLPVFVFASLVFPELRALAASRLCFGHNGHYLNQLEDTQVAILTLHRKE